MDACCSAVCSARLTHAHVARTQFDMMKTRLQNMQPDVTTGKMVRARTPL